MQDIVNKIIEIEKSSHKITNPAIKQKQELDHEIHNEIDELKANLYARAQIRIDKILNTEKQNYETNLQKINDDFQKKKKTLEQKYSEHKDLWINELYNTILGR